MPVVEDLLSDYQGKGIPQNEWFKVATEDGYIIIKKKFPRCSQPGQNTRKCICQAENEILKAKKRRKALKTAREMVAKEYATANYKFIFHQHPEEQKPPFQDRFEFTSNKSIDSEQPASRPGFKFAFDQQIVSESSALQASF